MINKWLFAIGAQLLLPSLLNAQTILGLDEPSRFTKLRPMLQVAATSTVLNARKHANLKAFVTQGVRMRYETISIKKPKGIPINGSFSLHEIGSAVDIGLVDDRHLRSVLALYAYHSGLSMPVESDRVHFELDWDIERLRYKRSALELSINRYVKENLKKVSNKNELEKEIREVFNLSEKVKIKITGAEINVWIEQAKEATKYKASNFNVLRQIQWRGYNSNDCHSLGEQFQYMVLQTSYADDWEIITQFQKMTQYVDAVNFRYSTSVYC